MGRLLVVGSTNVDLFTAVPRHPSPGETILGTGGQRVPGGKGANQALAAALQGADVTFVGCVGDDADAGIALGGLAKAGVDLSMVCTAADRATGMAVITVEEGGENTVVVVPGANDSVTPEQATEAVADLGEEDCLLMQGELPRETTERAARAAIASGCRVVLNVAPWMALDIDVLMAADPLVLNEHEAAQAVAELGLADLGQQDASHPEELIRGLYAVGARSVVLTLGAAGALVDDGSLTRVPSPKVTVVDTTGAGDAFVGVLAAQLVAGLRLDQAVRYAARVAAHTVQRAGAQPSYPEVGTVLL